MGYSAEEIKAIRSELAAAMKSVDIAAALEASVAAVEGDLSLIHCAARANVLPERFLNSMIALVFERKERAHLDQIVNDQTLGHETLRAFWREASRSRDADPSLSLAHLIKEYRRSDPVSLSRLKWITLIFTQAYREKSWDFVLSWMRGATDTELARLNNRAMYGVLVGLINDGRSGEAAEILTRCDPYMTDLDRLFFTVPRWRLDGRALPPTNDELVARLHAALPDRGPEWDWFCSTYRAKIAASGQDFLNARMNEDMVEELRAVVRAAIEGRRPLSFLRFGDGETYRLPLPEIVEAYAGKLPEDDWARERSWWNRNLASKTQGDHFAELVLDALRNADIIGVFSAHRLIRDASDTPMTEKVTGRALLAHVHALGDLIPLHDKIVTEDRIHTIVYTPDFMREIISKADHVVVIGGLSPQEMALPSAEEMTFIALTPEQNKGLPTAAGARSIVDDFEALAQDVAAACKPGALALVSGGYLGKALVQAAKSAGAVALDIGSFADLLAGYHTRSAADAV